MRWDEWQRGYATGLIFGIIAAVMVCLIIFLNYPIGC